MLRNVDLSVYCGLNKSVRTSKNRHRDPANVARVFRDLMQSGVVHITAMIDEGDALTRGQVLE